MAETLQATDYDSKFNELAETERNAAEQTFQADIAAIDAAVTPEAESSLQTLTMGKVNGGTDPGNVGYTWAS